MRIACLQHVAFEGPGAIEHWGRARGHKFAITRLFQEDPLPDRASVDMLVVMGGPMSVHDEAEYPWLSVERRLVESCLGSRKFVLGVCLGSQVLAQCLGAKVYRNAYQEIGWFPIQGESADAGSQILKLPEKTQVLHWHGETYDLPAGCRHLASSAGCSIQAFEHPSALGLQFHLETTRPSLQELIRHCADEIGTGPFEQPAEGILAGEREHGDTARSILYATLDNIARRWAWNDFTTREATE